MSLLFPIGTIYPSQQGGPSNTIYWLAKALKKKGIEITIITTDIGTNGKVISDKWLESNYGNVIYYSNQKNSFPWRLIYTSWRMIKNHDFVYLNSFFYVPSLILAIVSICKQKKVIWSIRGSLHPKAISYGSWKKLPILWLYKCFTSSRNVIFHATSEEESKNIKHFLGNSVKIVQIPNFIEVSYSASITPNTTTPFFLFIGRIHPIKAIDHLIHALNKSIYFKHSPLKLKIAGIGDVSYIEELKNITNLSGIQEKVEFIGLVEGVEKQKLYAQAYFTILPSHSENFGNVVVESLSHGTPVISSHGTPWAVLEETKAGFWVDNSPISLAKAIDTAMIMQESEYKSYRENALTLASEKFDIDKHIEKWLDIFKTDKGHTS